MNSRSQSQAGRVREKLRQSKLLIPELYVAAQITIMKVRMKFVKNMILELKRYKSSLFEWYMLLLVPVHSINPKDWSKRWKQRNGLKASEDLRGKQICTTTIRGPPSSFAQLLEGQGRWLGPVGPSTVLVPPMSEKGHQGLSASCSSQILRPKLQTNSKEYLCQFWQTEPNLWHFAFLHSCICHRRRYSALKRSKAKKSQGRVYCSII